MTRHPYFLNDVDTNTQNILKSNTFSFNNQNRSLAETQLVYNLTIDLSDLILKST